MLLTAEPNLSLSGDGYKQALVLRVAQRNYQGTTEGPPAGLPRDDQGTTKGLAAARSPSYKHREPSLSLNFRRISYAAKPPCAGRTARRVAGTRRGQIRRGFLHG